MEFPSEVYDLVRKTGLLPLLLKLKDVLQIVAFLDGASWFDDDRYTARARPVRDLFYSQRQSLQNCRLVSKAYCEAASPLLFRSVKATSSHALPKILALSESNYAPCVREIIIDLSVFSDAVNTSEGCANDLYAILPICIRNLPSLRILTFAKPDAGNFSEELRQILLGATQITFKYGLFPKLEELDLCLPLAYDFGVLARSGSIVAPTKLRRPLKEVLSHLRHLHLGILDSSGSFGQRYQSYRSPASRSQTLFPNADHSKELFAFVEMATRLESLSISCTHMLDMDVLSTVNFRRLHVLVLYRIKVSMEKLQGLILENKSTIRALDFCQLELKSGTWESLLLSLCSLLRLKYLYINSCGYIHSSPHATGLLPPIDDPEDLETTHYEDYDALGDLQRHVMRVRDAAGLAQMTEYDFKWGYKKPLSSELSVSTD